MDKLPKTGEYWRDISKMGEDVVQILNVGENDIVEYVTISTSPLHVKTYPTYTFTKIFLSFYEHIPHYNTPLWETLNG